MSPQAGDEDGVRDSQPPPWALICHSVSGGCTVCCAGILLGVTFWGIWHPWAGRGAEMAQLWLKVAGLLPGGQCWDRLWAAPRKFVHVGER